MKNMATLMNFDAHVRAIFENDETKFVNFNKLMVDASVNKYEEGIDAKTANEKIRKVFREAIGVSENATKLEIRKAIKKRANAQVLFDLIEELVPNLLKSGWAENPFFREFVEERYLDEGDENIFYSEDNSVLTVSKVSGSHWDLDRQRLGKGTSFSIETSEYGIAVYSEYEKLICGLEDFATFITKIYEAIDRFVNEAIYQALMDAAEKLPGGASGAGQWVKTGALDDNTRGTLVQLVEDVQMATGANEVIIMGTKSALTKVTGLQNVDWISNEMKNERHTTGRMGVWEGIRLVEIKQGFALGDTTKKLVDDKVLFIMPVMDNKFIKLVNRGEDQLREVQDKTLNQDMTYDYRYMFQMGVGVLINLIFGEWILA
jgi:hypothetical protein